MTLSRDDYLRHLRADGAALTAAAAQNLDADVRGCPGWTVADLLAHTGQVHRYVTELVRTNSDKPVSRKDFPDPPAGAELVPWFDAGLGAVVAMLESADVDGFAWNWSGHNQKVGWWPRRMAQETAVHRWDTEDAVAPGSGQPIDAALAVDGVDEFLDLVLPNAKERGPYPDGGATVHLHATDAEGEWLLRFAGSGIEVSRGHAKGDAAVRGTASDLLLFLWKRLPPDAPGFEVFGDPSVLDNWVKQTQL